MKKDIQGLDDIKDLVNSFYVKVSLDEKIGPIFNESVHDWPTHLGIMYDFWHTVLFGKAAYRGNPFMKHIPLPIEGFHFAAWIKLFNETVDQMFTGPVASEAKQKANKIAEMFEYKLDRLKEGKNDLI